MLPKHFLPGSARLPPSRDGVWLPKIRSAPKSYKTIQPTHLTLANASFGNTLSIADNTSR